MHIIHANDKCNRKRIETFIVLSLTLSTYFYARDCRNKKIDLILTKNVSRFGRNTEEALIALRKLKDLGVEVIFQDDNLDTGRMDSELMLSIISAYAEQENTSHREDNQMWSMKKRLEDGSSEIYKRTCYGYISGEKGELRIDPGKAMVVQNIFKCYLDG